MPSKAFTDLWVASVKLSKGKKQEVYFDTKERIVLVVGSHAKTFRLLVYNAGKPKTIKLGRYPIWGLKEARDRARTYSDDPKKFAAQSNPDRFQDVSAEWFKRHVEASGLRTKGEIKRILHKYILPVWAERKFIEIRRGEVNRLLDHVVDNHGPSQADSVLKVIRSICIWYTARDEFYTSPVVAGMKRSKKADRKDLRFLSDEEIRLVWSACDQLGTFGRLVKFALLTGQRRGKLGSNAAALKWADIDRNGIWTIQAEPGEKNTAGKIKLPQMALDVLHEQPRIAGTAYVFPGAVSGKPYNAFSDGMTAIRELLPDDMPTWSMHDLRRTARKLMTRAMVRPDVAELAIGHSLVGLQKIYDDVQEYQPMIDAAFQSVADELEKILGTNIIPLRAQA